MYQRFARRTLALLFAAAAFLPTQMGAEHACRPVQCWPGQQRVRAVARTDVMWFDSLRSRHVPAVVYYPADDAGPLPAIVFSHGLGRSPDDYAYLGRHWASRGYVAVCLQHLGSDDSVWHGKLRPKKALREAWEDPLNAVNRRRDVGFAIQQLQALHDTGAGLWARLDLDRLGVAGNDFGAQTALVMAGQALPRQVTRAHPGVKAVVALSPPVPLGKVPLETAYSRIHVPCLYVTGTQDDGLVGDTKAAQRRLPFEYTSGVDQFLLTLNGADHLVFAGHKLDRARGQNDALYQRLICLGSTAFWDAYLKGDPAAKNWLAQGGLGSALGNAGWLEAKLEGSTPARPGLASPRRQDEERVSAK